MSYRQITRVAFVALFCIIVLPRAHAQTMRGYYEGQPIYISPARTGDYYLLNNENGYIDDLFIHRFSAQSGQVVASISISPPLPGRPQFRLSPRTSPVASGNHIWLMGTADTVYARRYTAALRPDSAFGREGWAVLGKRKEAPSTERSNWGLSLSSDGGLVAGEYLYRFDASGRAVAPADTARQCARGEYRESIPLSGGRIAYLCRTRLRRFTADGQRDPAFNGAADLLLHPEASASRPTFSLYEDTTRRRLLVLSRRSLSATPSRLLALTERGLPDSTFNAVGSRPLPDSMRLRGGAHVMTNWQLFPFGRGPYLLVAITEGGPVVARLRPDGMLDEAYAGASAAERGTDTPGYRLIGGGPPADYSATSVYPYLGALRVHYARRYNTNSACCDYESFVATYGGLPVSAEAPPVAEKGSGAGLRLSSPVPHPVGAGARARLVVTGAAAGERVEASLVDAHGRRVAGLVVGDDGAVEVETAGLPAGLYAVRVVGERSGAAVRVVVVTR